MFTALALLLSGLGGMIAWELTSPPPFTQKEIEKNKELRSISEYNTYCKEAAAIGIFSDEQINKKQYDRIVGLGFRKSIDSEGDVCWYNLKTQVKFNLFVLSAMKNY